MCEKERLDPPGKESSALTFVNKNDKKSVRFESIKGAGVKAWRWDFVIFLNSIKFNFGMFVPLQRINVKHLMWPRGIGVNMNKSEIPLACITIDKRIIRLHQALFAQQTKSKKKIYGERKEFAV